MKSPVLNSLALVAGVVVLATLGPVLVRAIGSLPHPRELAARADARVVSLDIGGMTCSGCAARVREELRSVQGVSAADVRLSDQRAVVVCAKSVADSALISAVHRAGPGFTAAPARD